MEYRVRFYLGSPIYVNAQKAKKPIMLDSLLGFIWAQEQGLRKTSAENIAENLVFPILPIKCIDKCYMASAMFLPNDLCVTTRDSAIVRHEMGYKKTKGIMNSFSSGGNSSYSPAIVKFWALATPYVDFYADVTDIPEFTRLVHKIKSIGPGRGVGFGRILRIEITECPNVNLDHITPDGTPTRPLPVDLFKETVKKDAVIGVSTFFPPYWFKKNEVLCYMPEPDQFTPAVMVSKDILEQIYDELTTVF